MHNKEASAKIPTALLYLSIICIIEKRSFNYTISLYLQSSFIIQVYQVLIAIRFCLKQKFNQKLWKEVIISQRLI